MSDVFISYARATAAQANAAAEALRAAGYSVWLDEDLPAHRPYAREIEAQLVAAKAALVLWSADAVKSEWVLSEADRARQDKKLVQAVVDGARLPMPFDQIQCADLAGWAGDAGHAGWRKALLSIAALANGEAPGPAEPAAAAPPRSAALPLPAKPSIAVLPFADLSPGKDQDYFCDGMVVEIATALSRFRTIFVIASGSSLTYRDVTQARLPEIARELGVRFLLEGSVRKAGERVRITVQLVDTHDSAREVWAERFDDTLEDIFELQDRVASAVASQIEPTLIAIDVRRAVSRPTEDLTAYDLYLQGLRLFGAMGAASHTRAIALLEQAIGHDPGYAEALSLAAFLRTNRLVLGWSPDPEEDHRIALDYRSRALTSLCDDPEVLAMVAMTSMQLETDPSGALAAARRALARLPGSSTVQTSCGWVFLYAGDSEAALAAFETALRYDPRSMFRQVVLFAMAFANLFLRRFEAVLPLAKEAGELMPDLKPFCAALSGSALGHLGRRDEAKAAVAGVDLMAQRAMLAAFAPQDRDTVLAGLGLAMAEG